MLAILGDIHGDLQYLAAVQRRAKEHGASALIQVGDFGFDAHVLRQIRLMHFALPTFAIDGNHEDFRCLRDLTAVTEFAPNFSYVPRGTALDLDDRRIGFLGGAGSIDKDIRLFHGLPWHPEEQITDADVMKTIALGHVDILITHGPPQSTVTKHWETVEGLRYRQQLFGVPPEWADPSLRQIERAWRGLNSPPLYCGHMHRTLTDDTVHVLDINELCFV